jgi:hypothetical protein
METQSHDDHLRPTQNVAVERYEIPMAGGLGLPVARMTKNMHMMSHTQSNIFCIM